ncbi:MAG: Ig-like domain repeat protein [Cytophagaceae bacterium]
MKNKNNFKILKTGGQFILGCLLIGATIFSEGCKKKTDEPDPTDQPPSSAEIVEISAGDLPTQTWTKDKVYRLNGYVRVQDGNVLTIEKGTLVVGDRESKGTLIIQRGGKIMAEGTADEPIVMTSEREPGRREPGDWGGLVICGRAKNNIINGGGGEGQLEGNYGAWHGGTDDDDNSGIVRYVRIEFAGIPINPNQEVNSLTMGSVGRGTVIDHVMCSYGLDDAFEWFGGTVNCKNLIAYRCLDDDLDVDEGYSGKVQYALSIRGAILSDQSGSNGFEVDNDGTGSNNQPYTSGVFANVTVVGPKKHRETPIGSDFQHAAQLRRNSRISIYNTFMTAYPWGLFIDDAAGSSSSAALNDELQVRNVILAGVEGWGSNGYGLALNEHRDGTNGLPYTFVDPQDGVTKPRGNHGGNQPKGSSLRWRSTFSGATEASDAPPTSVQPMVTWFQTAAYKNQRLAKWQDAGIDVSIFENGIPKVTPNAGSMLLTSADWNNCPKAQDNFFDKVNFIGAFGTTDWTTGWAEWEPQIKPYL